MNPAFLFPGQASQFAGMGRDLCERFQSAREIFAQADSILGLPLSRICFRGAEEELRQTRITQPAVFVHSVACWQVIVAGVGQPACVAGHSVGEYTALVAAGVVDFRTGLELVRRRAEIMQEAGARRAGSMVAVIGLADDVVEELCRQASEAGTVEPANYNAPGQLVVSGDKAAMERLAELARAAGAKRVMPLAVSGAFHSPLMEEAGREMDKLLQDVELAPARMPLISNVTALPATDPEEIRRNLSAQMTQPVRWVESVRKLRQMGVRHAFEVGPGGVLKGLVRRIARDMQVRPAGTADQLSEAAGAGWPAG